MPKVSLVNPSLVFIVSLVKPYPTWEVSDWLLDSSGFPWAVHAILKEGELLLLPMRDLSELKHQIGTLIPYEEGTAAAYLNRVFDYMSRIEAHDVAVTSVRSGTWFDSWGANEWVVDPHHDFKHDTNVAPKSMVVITDENGIEWGPLSCNLMEAPDVWPFRGGIKSKGLTFEPIPNAGDCWTVKMSPFQTDIREFSQLIKIVQELMEYGWLEMVRRNYPNGMSLVRDHGVPQADIDVDQEDLDFG